MKKAAVPSASPNAPFERSGENDDRRFGQASRPRWCAVLVSDHTQLFLLERQAEHSSQEVLAADIVDPSRTQNNVSTFAGDDRLVALQLGLAIDAERASGIVLFVGTSLTAIVDVIGGVVDHQGTAARAFLCESRRSSD